MTLWFRISNKKKI